MNHYLLNSSEYEQCNIKMHDLVNIYLPKYCKTIYVNSRQAIEFIEQHNETNVNIILYHHFYVKSDLEHDFHVDIIKYLQSKEDVKCQIVIFAFDWWREPVTRSRPRREHTDLLFFANNYKVIVSTLNLEQLSTFHNRNFKPYEHNIFHNKFLYCYDSSYIDFNSNPIKQLLVSGNTSERYPERHRLIKLTPFSLNIVQRPRNIVEDSNNNNFNMDLNKYIACFSSCIYIENFSTNKLENIHSVLLKSYEILAVGSLLVMPECEKEYIKQIGLMDRKNCYLINFNDTDANIIRNIDDMLNDPSIDKIRREGQILAKTELNSLNKFNELKHILLPEL